MNYPLQISYGFSKSIFSACAQMLNNIANSWVILFTKIARENNLLSLISTIRDQSEIRLVHPGICPHRDELSYVYPSSCTQNIPSYRNKWLRSIFTKLCHHPMAKVVSVAKPGFNAPACGLRPRTVAARKTKSAPLPNLLHAKSMHS